MDLSRGDAGAALASGPLPLELTLRYATQIADASTRPIAGHRASRSEAGERDDHEERVKLLDFGLAKASRLHR
jgi:hypothetical protein